MDSIKKNLRGFTLIELLLVIAILGILIVALLVVINPGEAQKKARDTKRIADLRTLTTIVSQYLNDNPTAANLTVNSTGITTAQNSQACGATSWLTVNTCTYAATVPLDPINGKTAVSFTNNAGTAFTATAGYYVVTSGVDYEVNVYQESLTNKDKVANDGGLGGTATQFVEAGTNLALR